MIFCFFVFCGHLFGEVVATISQPRVYYRGESEAVGSITFSVRADDFAEASPENPVYLLLDFKMGAVLSETWVDIAGGDPQKTPIFFQAVLHTEDTSSSLQLSENAISIVRWRAGETGIWIKITESSSAWLQIGDALSPPDQEHSVSWSIGLDPRIIQAPVLDPVATNRPSTSREDGNPVSTEMRFDLTGSTIHSSGIESLLSFFPYFYDGATRGVEDAETVAPGNLMPIVYDGGTTIAQGWERLGETSYIFPWVSNNDRFESLVVVNNFGRRPVTVSFHARRASGADLLVREVIPARGSMASPATELFSGFEKGPGFTVEMQTTEDTVAGRWITYNRAVTSNRSPSQANAVKWHALLPNEGDFLGEAVMFGYLPTDADFFSGPVLVNTGTHATDVTLYFFDKEGRLILKDEQTVLALSPFQPFVVPVTELIARPLAEINLIAVGKTSLLTGVSFIFNQAGEPAMGNVQSIPFDSSDWK